MSSPSEWDAALDALEEWVRRTVADIAAPEPHRPPSPPTLPEGLVPEPLRLRCQVLVATMRDAEAAVLKRREQLRREHAYGAA